MTGLPGFQPVHGTYDHALSASRLRGLRSAAIASEMTGGSVITPMDTTAAAGNELRPTSWDEVVGQQLAKGLLARMVETSRRRGTTLDHILLVGPSGTGKTTLAHVIATELQSRVWQLEAPIDADTLFQLSELMTDGDILFLDEIHQQAAGDRRGRSSSTNPEVLFSVMEDFTLPTGQGVVPFPRVTIMGATTDEGALPDAFINRFPIRPRLERYSDAEMTQIATFAAGKKGMKITPVSARIFGEASRSVPREINNFIKAAAMLTESVITPTVAAEVVKDLFGYTLDGLTGDQQGMLTFLYTSCEKESKGETVWRSSVSSIATAIGKSRDVKAVQLRVEPFLIEKGYVQVQAGGRALTAAGVARAVQLLNEGS